MRWTIVALSTPGSSSAWKGSWPEPAPLETVSNLFDNAGLGVERQVLEPEIARRDLDRLHALLPEVPPADADGRGGSCDIAGEQRAGRGFHFSEGCVAAQL